MSILKPTLDEDISLSDALDSQQAILTKLEQPEQQQQFYDHLVRNINSIIKITSQLLGIKEKQCFPSPVPDEWLRGSFNVCIPIRVTASSEGDRYYMFRVPLPYKIGEKFAPGNVDEKIRSEAGTYAWIKENCPDIPIPCLRGFGLTNGSFVSYHYEQLTVRCHLLTNQFVLADQKPIRKKKPFFKLGSAPKPSVQSKQSSYRSVADPVENALGTGFLLLDNIESKNSCMLSDTWKANHHDNTKRTTFFSHLARIMLSLAQIPHKKIASPCFNDNCMVTFNNRPMTPYLAQMENEKVPIPIQRNNTFKHCSAYASDLLRCQDNYLYHARNSVSDEDDAQFQAAILTGMRAIQPSFFPDSSLRGPFHMAFTDLHSSNIFVDSDWRITCVIDLEWMGTRPLEMISPPDWFCDWDENLAASPELRVLQEEFVSVLQLEEDKLRLKRQKAETTTSLVPSPHLGDAMRRGLVNGAQWYFLALNSFTLTTFIWGDAMRDRYFNPIALNKSDKISETALDKQQPNPAVVVPIRTIEKTNGTLKLENGDFDAISPSSATRHQAEDIDDDDEEEEDCKEEKNEDNEKFYTIASQLWRQNYSEFVIKKLNDRAQYVDDIRKKWEEVVVVDEEEEEGEGEEDGTITKQVTNNSMTSTQKVVRINR